MRHWRFSPRGDEIVIKYFHVQFTWQGEPLLLSQPPSCELTLPVLIIP